MLSPLPRNKRAKHPNQAGNGAPAPEQKNSHSHAENNSVHASGPAAGPKEPKNPAQTEAGFQNNPFSRLSASE
jgi:hypothetical protein